MTAERDTVSLGSCPDCGGPAQFIAPSSHANGCTAPLSGICICSESSVRAVALPNVDEDLGGGWVLRELKNRGLLTRPERRWVAEAHVARPSGGLDMEYGWADSPSAAYLALRSAIEARS